MPIPEISYVLVTSWYGFTCGNLIPWNADWAPPQALPHPLVAPVLSRCVRVVGCGSDRCPDQREAEVGIGGGARARVLPQVTVTSVPGADGGASPRGGLVLAVVVVWVVLLAGPPVAAGDQLADRDAALAGEV